MQTMQQKRAKYALEKVESARKLNVKQQKEYKSYASGFPAMIQMNGLGQAAAFYFSQGGTHKILYDLLSGWLTQPDQPYAGIRDLLHGVTQRDMHAYRLAQAEALALLEWVKQFAKAYMEAK
jgi:CRISPR-associated protein Cmr5